MQKFTLSAIAASDRRHLAVLIAPMLASLLVLAVGLLITSRLWLNEQQNFTQVMQTRFDGRVKEFENFTTNRIQDYEQLLLGMRGLFSASASVERYTFRKYVASLNLEKDFPGAQGICFSMIIPPAQKDQHIASVRMEGFLNYTIKPDAPRDFYTSAIYLEPFVGSNLRALGYDNFTDAIPRAAMEEARDSGKTSISGKVAISHASNKNQSGFRMNLPVFKNGTSTHTVEERRKNILGWLYVPIRMDDFMKDALSDRSDRLDIEIFDGDKMTTDTLMYDSDPSRSYLFNETNALFKTVKHLNILGHTWTLAAHSLPNFDVRVTEGRQEFIIYSGMEISLLLAAFTFLLMYGRRRILRDAQVVARSEARLSSVIESALDAVIQMDSGGRVIGWNNQAEIMFGWPRDLAMGQVLEEMIIPVAHRKKFRASMKKFLVPSKDFAISGWGSALNARSELFALRRDGSEFAIELSMNHNMLGDSDYQFTAFIHDITKRRERDEEQRLAVNVLNTVEEAVMVTDTENRIIRVNPAFTAITGYTAEEVLGKDPSLLSAEKYTLELYREMLDAINDNGLWQGEIWDRRKNGEIYVKWLTVKSVNNEKGELTHYLNVFSDISERKATEEQMKRLAHHDALTDLPNRVLFNDRLQQALNKAKRNKGHLALMFIDLDRFKPINDTYGHAVGDLLLKEVAVRLLKCVRESDTVSRIGGDEFVILLPAIEREADAALIADKVLGTLRAPFELAGHSLSISSSIGTAIYPEHGENELLLFKNADTAMYYAKNSGRDNIRVYQPDMREV